MIETVNMRDNGDSFQVLTLSDGGFCDGVQRAVKTAVRAAEENLSCSVFTLGEIVHNPLVVQDLRRRGVGVVHRPDEVAPGSVVVIRSHGVAPEVAEELKARSVRIVDATCPRVRRVQRAAENYRNRGIQVVIVGRKDHPEVQGVLARCGPDATVVASTEQAEALPPAAERAVLFQTTFDPDEGAAILDSLRSTADEVRVERTLCDVVAGRRNLVREIARRADAVVVVGGKNSSNTSLLVNMVLEAGKPAFRVEDAKGLVIGDFSDFSSVGVVGGTSTPQASLDAVRERILEFRSAAGDDRED
ncbi:MAG: 4-hydroxy-3-methylbut-2-enyl diphosphate reductase [Bacillota bacterium]